LPKSRSVVIAIAVAALTAPAAVAVAAKVPRGAQYAGKTDEGLDVALRASKSGLRVARLRINYRVSCDNGAQGTPSTDVFDMRIGRGGGFGYRGSYIGRVDHSRNRVVLRGKIGAQAASGTFALSAVGKPRGSAKPVRCHTKTVSWQATREP
jgi:hypothetical protein